MPKQSAFIWKSMFFHAENYPSQFQNHFQYWAGSRIMVVFCPLLDIYFGHPSITSGSEVWPRDVNVGTHLAQHVSGYYDITMMPLLDMRMKLPAYANQVRKRCDFCAQNCVPVRSVCIYNNRIIIDVIINTIVYVILDEVVLPLTSVLHVTTFTSLPISRNS